MEKIIKVEGMSCSHCKTKVEDALQKIEGVKAVVNLKKKQVSVKSKVELDDVLLLSTINEAGFEASDISLKKGLFN